MKNLFYILLLTSFLSNAQITLMPDPNFEQELINQNIDSDGIINGQVATADISSLATLTIQGANITDATGIEDFTSLISLTLKGNGNLTSIDVSNLTQLLVLDLRNNNLSSLDVSNIASLLDLRAQGNQLTAIDLSSNTQLNAVTLQSNSLESLNIKNGTNTNISGSNFKANNNPNLFCIQVDDVAYSTTNWTIIDAGVVFRTNSCVRTLIPDSNFEQALIDLGFDSDGTINGGVLTNDINTRTSLVVPSKNISDATGVEDFIALEEIYINNNNLTSIDVSNLQQLKLFRGSDNPSLTNFIHGNNPNIEHLFFIDTDINVIDVTQFSLLIGLYLSNTSISQLDVSNNLNLSYLRIDGTNISQIDVSNNSQLIHFYGQNTLLTALDLSNNSGLASIKASDCPNLNTLNVKSGNNTNVNTFEAQNNPNLFCIQVDNDAYSTANWTNIDAQADFSTSCAITLIPDTNFEQVLIDLGIDSDGIINGKVYTTDINTITTLDVPSKNISDATGIEDFTVLEKLYIYDNELIDIDISTLLFLEILNIGNNNLMSLDISNSQQLKQLLAGGNSSLVNFIYNNNTNLYNIYLSSSIITTIDISQFPLLRKLSLSNTLFTELNLSNNSNLTEIVISNCPNLNTLNVKNGDNTNVTIFEALNNPSLNCIQVDDPVYSSANWPNRDIETAFDTNSCTVYTLIPDPNFEQALIDQNIDSDGTLNGQVLTSNISSLGTLTIQGANITDATGIEDFTSLISLTFKGNPNLTSIDVSNLTQLLALDLRNNNLSSLDVSGITSLVDLNAQGNQLTTIDLSSNTQLNKVLLQTNALERLNIKNGTNTNISGSNFKANNNPNLNCIQVDDVLYSATNWSSIDGDPLTVFRTTSCAVTLIPDPNFEQALIDLSIDSDGIINGKVFTSDINGRITLDVNGKNISDATGIEDFVALEILGISNNNLTSIDVSNLQLLDLLNISNNDLISINLSNLQQLKVVDISNNDLSSIDISNLQQLTNFDASNNTVLTSFTHLNNPNIITLKLSNTDISTIDVSPFNLLEQLYLTETSIVQLDVSTNTKLILLSAEVTGISQLDVSNNSDLETLRVGYTSLTTLDVSNNSHLVILNARNTLLTALDLSNNNSIDKVNVPNCPNLSSLNVKTAIHSQYISVFNALNTPSLSCIVVRNPIYCTNNWTNIDPGTVFRGVSCAVTLIPDTNFEQALIDLSIDTDGIINGQVFTNDINTLTSLDVTSKNITDATGIEDFVALRDLILNSNNLTSLDVSNLQELRVLSLANNTSLTNVIFENNSNIEKLILSNTNINSINVSPFPVLDYLYLTNTSISQLDVSNNPDLERLRITETNISQLDVSNNSVLQQLFAQNTLVAELDLSANSNLTDIGVSNCPNLNTLNVKNGNNTNVTTFEAQNNPNLNCIQVDDVTYSDANWTTIDAGTIFITTSCAITLIPDANFEQALIDLGFDSDGIINGQVYTSDINTITTLQIPNKNISDATGLEDFVALEILRMKGNTLSSIDISNLQQLIIINLQNNTSLTNFIRGNHPYTKKLFVDNTNLNTLDATMFPLLENLTVRGTPLSQLDITNCPNLITLDISYSSLLQIDVSNNNNLDIFISENSLLSELDLSHNSNLTEITIFDCSNLSALNLKNGNNMLVRVFKAELIPNLYCIQVDDAIYSTNNWIKIDAGTVFSETSCAITLIPDTNFEQALIDLSIDSDGIINGQVFTDDINTLTNLNVATKNISDLTGIEDFVALTSLICYTNNLSVLDVSTNTNLVTLQCHDNILDSIDVSMLSGLVTFYPADNNLTSIDVSANLLLKNFNLQNNAIGSLDVSNNTALERLQAHHLAITELDLTNNPDLTGIFVYNNTNLSSLNIKSGSNTTVIDFNANNNPNLSCIQVDDAVYSTTNWANINGGTSFSEFCSEFYTYVPDDNFEQKLIDLGHDDVLDDYVLTANINTLTNLNISNNNMTDATGIEDFVALETLRIVSSDLITIDVSNLTQLKILDLNNNAINTLDVSNLILLEELDVFDNNLTTIDISNNLALITLNLFNNPLGNIDISAQVNLEGIGLNNTGLTTLDVSQNTLLRWAELKNNNLTTLDFSLQSGLGYLDLRNNDLSALNVKNGTNTMIFGFRATGNPNLTCIQVDNAGYSTNNWTDIDAQTSFSQFCPEFSTYVPDDNFEQKLIDLGHDDVLDDYVLTANINTLTSLIISYNNMTDATGIEDFVALETLRIVTSDLINIDVSNLTQLKILDLNNNDINTLDVSNLILLEELLVYQNNLSVLNISSLSLLETLDVSENNLIALDFSSNLVLKNLTISNNTIGNIDINAHVNLEGIGFENIGLTTLNVSQNTLLKTVILKNNNLTELDFSSHLDLLFLDVQNNDLSALNVKNSTNVNIFVFTAIGNPNLTCIQVDDAAYSTANWSNIDAQASFSEDCFASLHTYVPDDNFEQALIDLGYDDVLDDYVLTENINTITNLDVSNRGINDLTGIEDFIALELLSCYSNSLSSLDVTQNINLTYLICNNNELSSLDISNNTNLIELICSNNELTSLNLGISTTLDVLRCNDNLLASIDISQNTGLTEFNGGNNPIVSLELLNYNLIDIRVSGCSNLSSLNLKNGNNTNVTMEAFNNPDLYCIQVDNAAYSTANWTNIDPQTSFSEDCNPSILVSAKVYLQGAAINSNTGEENLMRDDLRVTSLIPITSPYSDGLVANASVFTIVGADAIVDWVLVELRDETDNTIVIDSQSAFLQRDGDIVNVDGVSEISFSQATGNYYIVVKHRNHLGIMSASALALSSTTTIIDFSNGDVSTFGTNAQTILGLPIGVQGLWSGDVNGDAIVQYSGGFPDVPAVLSYVLNDVGNFLNLPTFSVVGYSNYDVDMDGITQYTGSNPEPPIILQNVLVYPSNFLNLITWPIEAQLPTNMARFMLRRAEYINSKN